MQRIKSYILPITVLLLFIVSYYPSFAILIQKWSDSEDYAHAFFAIPIVIYMIWLKRDQLTARRGRPVIGLILVIFSILLYLFSLQLQIPTIIFLATVFTVISGFIYFYGFSVLKELAIPFIVLFLVIPIPNQILSMVTSSLQLKISYASEMIVQLFSVPLLREGNVLHIPDKTFQIVEACSGIRSLITLITLSFILSYFSLEKWWSISLLFLLSIPVAIFINIVRVVSLILAYYFFKFDLSFGTEHAVMGVVLFVLGLVMLLLFQRILEFWEEK